MTAKIPSVPCIELFGDIDENFYQLGLRDRESGKLVHSSVKSMLKTPFTPVNLLMEEVGKQVIKNSFLKETHRYSHLRAYADGMNIAAEEVFYSMLIPELVSAMTKWAPGIVAGNLGCSSFFTLNENKEMIHGRILDFPLQGSFDEHERIVSYQLNGMPKTLGFGSSGIPYPSITCMTESGMTVALHQKFTNIFNTNGEFIFEIIFELIKNANDKKSAIEFLKSKQSLTTWCLYMGFNNGDVLAYDLMGQDHFYNEYQIEENKILYFSNHLENIKLDQNDYLPLGFEKYNFMRDNSAQEKIKSYIVKSSKKNINCDIDLLKMMTSPKKDNLKTHYQMDCLTPSSITAVTMNPKAEKCHFITGAAPKYYQNNIVCISDTFGSLEQQFCNDTKFKDNGVKEIHSGMHAIMKAQHGFDDKDPQVIYHELQFAIDHFENRSEKNIAHFYFLIAQYIYETHPKVLFHLLSEFKLLDNQLPDYLNDHCLLFIARLEYILKLPPSLEEDRIHTLKLREILKLELKIPRTIFHFTNRLMIVPRVDILDVIYVYTY